MDAVRWERAMQELVYATVDQQILDVSVGDTDLELEAAASHTTRVAGLANRDDMPQDGMIFLYEVDVQKAYHRTQMRFPITIRFYDAAGQLVHVDTDNQIVESPVPYRYVVETHSDLDLDGRLFIHGLA